MAKRQSVPVSGRALLPRARRAGAAVRPVGTPKQALAAAQNGLVTIYSGVRTLLRWFFRALPRVRESRALSSA